MKKPFAAVALVAILGLLVISCTNENIASLGEDCVHVNLSGIEGVRSVLDDDIATKVSEVTLAAYDPNGLLEATYYTDMTSGSSLELTLNSTRSHTVYAFVNMGYVSVPFNKNEINSIDYYIDSYDDINSRGLPMSGSTTIPENATECTIEVRRLMARLTLTMKEGEVTPDKISEVRLCNWNKHLSPFDSVGCKAVISDDVASGDEGHYESISNWSGESLVFYVPENMQGTLLPENTDQKLKTAAAIGEMAELCTYLEVDAEIDYDSSTGVYGNLTYRFYLGSDTTSNFDVEGNHDYSLSFSLTWNGQFYEDEWMVDNDGLYDLRELSLSSVSVTPGSDGYNISSVSNATLAEGWETAVLVSMLVDGTDIAESTFGKSGGWCVPDSCVTRLEGLGISCETGYATMVYDTEGFMPRLIRSGDEIPDTCDELGEEKKPMVILGMDKFDYSRNSVPLTVQTSDGNKKANIDILLRPYIDPSDITLDADDSGHYIGQRHLLSLEGIDDCLTPTQTSSLSEISNVIGLTSLSSDEFYVDMIGSGTEYICLKCSYYVTGPTKVQWTQIVKRVDVKAPQLLFSEDKVTLSFGTLSSSVSLGYYDDNGNALYCPGSEEEYAEQLDADSYEYEYDENVLHFCRPLFSRYLQPQISLKLLTSDIDAEITSDSSDTSADFVVVLGEEDEGWITCQMKIAKVITINGDTDICNLLGSAVDCDDIDEATLTVAVTKLTLDEVVDID